jgi:hypothetical protein
MGAPAIQSLKKKQSTKGEIMREQISHYIRAGYSGLYLVSHEEQRVEAEIKAVATALEHQLFAWSITEGLIDTKKGTTRECNDPMEVLIIEPCGEARHSNAVSLFDFVREIVGRHGEPGPSFPGVG